MSDTTKTTQVTASTDTTKVNVRYITVTAMLSAVAFILMFFDFSVPFMPSLSAKTGSPVTGSLFTLSR